MGIVVIPKLVTNEMNANLCALVANPEIIKQAVFQLGANKALGPDELNGEFFQQHWEIIQEDVYRAVGTFFREGALLESINETQV